METDICLKETIQKLENLLKQDVTISSSVLYKCLYYQESTFDHLITTPQYNGTFLYYIDRPINIKLADVFDFVQIDITHEEGYITRIGMPFIMQGANSIYYLRFVSEWLTDDKLIPFINHGQVFIFY